MIRAACELFLIGLVVFGGIVGAFWCFLIVRALFAGLGALRVRRTR